MAICIGCGKNVKRYKSNKRKLCEKCYSIPLEECSICHKIKNVHNRENELIFCDNCYRKKKRKQNKKIMICFSCKEPKPIYKNTICGPYCYECYMAPLKKCCGCGEFKKNNKFTINGPICVDCYEQPKEKCSCCPNIDIVVQRDENGNPICKNCYLKKRKLCDEIFKIKENIKKHIQSAFRRFSKTGKKYSSKVYGIDYNKIIEYLGPCPGNREDYHIDHIFPLSAFDFNNPLHIQIAFSPENHRWLPKFENMKKGSKYNEKDFEEFIKCQSAKIVKENSQTI